MISWTTFRSQIECGMPLKPKQEGGSRHPSSCSSSPHSSGDSLPHSDHGHRADDTHRGYPGGLVWRMARRIIAAQSGTDEAEFVDTDPWGEPTESATSGGEASSSKTPSASVKEHVLKMSSLLDQSDESELLPPQAQEIDKWFQNYQVVMGAQPDESEEPTSSQLGALAKRVFSENKPPYADFSVWTPYERRMTRVQQCRVFRPLGDGSYLQQDLPGPNSFMAWKASWNVFKTAAVMLNIASIASLEAYFKQIERTTIQWPSCWGLVYTADDAARAERMEKVRRRLRCHVTGTL